MYLGHMDQYFCFNTLNSMCLLFSQGVILTPWFSGVDLDESRQCIASALDIHYFSLIITRYIIYYGGHVCSPCI